MATYFSDRPAATDSLGRMQFASHLAKALLSVGTDDGLVVGIEGEWGSGKSSVIGFIKQAVLENASESNQPIIVDFNPWIVSNSGALIDALIAQIAASINVNSSAPEKALKAGEKLLEYVSLIKHLKYLKYVPGTAFLGHIAQDAAELADGVSAHTSEARSALDDMKKLIPNLDLARRKTEVAEALRDFARPIVIILDDLDRLPAEEIRVVVQAIKAVADFPKTTYLLAYDRNVVANALGNGNTAFGLAYLEKIVQVAYPIPPLFEYQLRDFTEKQITSLLSSLKIELRDFEVDNFPKATGLVTKLSRHPRDIVRLMNRLMLSLSATRDEVNTTDVIVFEAISQRFPHFRESVHRHPTDFTGYAFRGDASFEDDDFDWTEWAALENDRNAQQPRWSKYLPEQEHERAIATKACAFLFGEGSGKHERIPEDELRIADPDRLARYFRMMSLESVPEASSIHEKLQKPEMLSDAISDTDQAGLIFVLEWLYNYLPSCAQPDVEGCCKVVIDRSLELEAKHELTRDLVELFAKVLERLLRKATQDIRGQCFSYSVDQAPLSIAEKLLLDAAAEQGKWVVRPAMIKQREEQFISDDDIVNSAIEHWSSRVRRSAESGELVHEPRLQSVLYRFAQLNYAYDETYKLVEKICTTDDGLQAFLAPFVRNSPFNNVDSFGLVRDPNVLAERIRKSALNEEYSWLATQIEEPELKSAIINQTANLLKLKRPDNKKSA